ncbi:MAG: response regulator transcription factor [Rhizobiaceae bacterium]|nr:MAG: response regulator transcription factor [Rhizobiaceae bacterium]
MIRLIIADDHTIFREGLKQILAEEIDLALVAEAANGIELLARLGEVACDIVLLDLSMPGHSGIALVRAVGEVPGGHRIVVLSMHEERQYVAESLKAGAAGYVTKNSASDQLLTAIRKVFRGEIFVSAAVPLPVPGQLRAEGGGLPHTRLTPREREVFDLLIAGRKLSRIARDLNLSIKTVSTHKSNLLLKMGAETTADLVRYALRHDLG